MDVIERALGNSKEESFRTKVIGTSADFAKNMPITVSPVSMHGNLNVENRRENCIAKMEAKWCFLATMALLAMLVTYQFENLFSKRNTPVAHASGFWDYHSFITAAAEYQPHGFGTTGGKFMGQKEVAAFLGHVGSKTSCGYGVATGGPLAWGLCYNKEMSPSQTYCDDYYKYTYPCTPGVSYHGRGALPLYWNYNYGKTGEALKIDLLNHPEHIENNATLAFQAAMWKWMTPEKKHLPFSARCDDESMNNIVSHYLYYLDLMGVGREEAGSHEVLSCAEQLPFNQASASASSS
ncbi:CHITINASE-LIKE PROTEIN 1 [Salix koriyanagi]|uniref:CHITINASE-LIKE PROTEIN 1 n=1 Tax=Salix koriyanagi TaxID=2511006 RepID=A0A9Q0WU55_9ROSI|nr:CHITINASE-LIKE PROTEIN 1 [Salix koriyanagi]